MVYQEEKYPHSKNEWTEIKNLQKFCSKGPTDQIKVRSHMNWVKEAQIMEKVQVPLKKKRFLDTK